LLFALVYLVLRGRDEEIKTPGTRTNYAEGATLLKDPRSRAQEEAPLKTREGEGGTLLRQENTPSSKDPPSGSPNNVNTASQPERPPRGGIVTRFYVAALLHYTVERPDAWTAEDEAEHVRSNTIIGQYSLDDVEITHFEPAESEGGEG
jgi:hypothetical protein